MHETQLPGPIIAQKTGNKDDDLPLLPHRRRNLHLTEYDHLLKRRRQPTGCLRLIFFSTSYPSIPQKILEDIGMKCRGMDVIFALTYPGPEKTLKT